MNTMSGLPAAEDLRPLTAYEIECISGGGVGVGLTGLPNITTIVNIGPIGVLTQVAVGLFGGTATNWAGFKQFSWLGVGVPTAS